MTDIPIQIINGTNGVIIQMVDPWLILATFLAALGAVATAIITGFLYRKNLESNSMLKAISLLTDDEHRKSRKSVINAFKEYVKNFLKKAAEYGFAGQMHQEYLLARPVDDNPSDKPELKNFKKAFSYISGKSIDLLHEGDDGTFDIIEAKTKLNWSAVGQAIGYKKIFCRLNNIPPDKVRSNIVCNQSDGFVEYVCDELGIKVIVFELEP